MVDLERFKGLADTKSLNDRLAEFCSIFLPKFPACRVQGPVLYTDV